MSGPAVPIARDVQGAGQPRQAAGQGEDERLVHRRVVAQGQDAVFVVADRREQLAELAPHHHRQPRKQTIRTVVIRQEQAVVRKTCGRTASSLARSRHAHHAAGVRLLVVHEGEDGQQQRLGDQGEIDPLDPQAKGDQTEQPWRPGPAARDRPPARTGDVDQRLDPVGDMA